MKEFLAYPYCPRNFLFVNNLPHFRMGLHQFTAHTFQNVSRYTDASSASGTDGGVCPWGKSHSRFTTVTPPRPVHAWSMSISNRASARWRSFQYATRSRSRVIQSMATLHEWACSVISRCTTWNEALTHLKPHYISRLIHQLK